jgi:hypothetical protein
MWLSTARLNDFGQADVHRWRTGFVRVIVAMEEAWLVEQEDESID